jgi:hypothetical protein
MIPLNKWEMPTQINGWSMGYDSSQSCFYSLVSQSDQGDYVRVEFGQSKEVRVCKTADRSEATVPSRLAIPVNAHSAHLLDCITEGIFVVNGRGMLIN